MSFHRGVSGPPAPPARPAFEFTATGTRWRIFHDGSLPEPVAAQLAAAVAEDEARWSRFRADSELSQVNRAAGAWCRVSGATVELVEASRRWTLATDGVFNPLIGAALRDWGYRESVTDIAPGARAAPRSVPVESVVEVDRARSAVRIPAGAWLDLGGIGKGWIADRVAARAQALSAADVLIDAGGDLVAARGEYLITIEPSVEAAAGSPGPVSLAAGQAIATSGSGRRRWLNGDGTSAHHLIDPATGAPGGHVQATVLADRGDGADVWAKVLSLRPALLERCPYPAVLQDGERVVGSLSSSRRCSGGPWNGAEEASVALAPPSTGMTAPET